MNLLFSNVTMSYTLGSGFNVPVTTTQAGAASYINNGPHIYSAFYDQGGNPSQRVVINNLPTLLPFRITAYTSSFPNQLSTTRSGTLEVASSDDAAQTTLSYTGSGSLSGGAVAQWSVTAPTGVLTITQLGGDLPLSGILFDLLNTQATATTTGTATGSATTSATASSTTTRTATGTATGTATTTPTPIMGITQTLTALAGTGTATGSATSTTTRTATATTTGTATGTATGSATTTPTPIINITPTLTALASTATSTASATASATASETPCNISFTDVRSNTQFRDDILYLACRGIVNGFPNGDGTFRFEPNSNTRRGEFAKIVVRSFNVPSYTPTSGQTFRDVPRSNVFFNFIEAAAHAGAVNGFPDGTFRPNNNITRAEVAAIIYRIRQYQTFTPGGSQTFRDVPPSYFAYNAIETLAHLNIINGQPCATGSGTCFRPNDAIRRGELSKVDHNAIITNP